MIAVSGINPQIAFLLEHSAICGIVLEQQVSQTSYFIKIQSPRRVRNSFECKEVGVKQHVSAWRAAASC